MLLHQIPPKPAYFRAKVQRRLKGLGAVLIKNSAYLLPATSDTLEDFQWLVGEIRSGGGGAWLFRSDVMAGFTNEVLEREFTRMATEEYDLLAKDATIVIDALRAEVELVGPPHFVDGANHRKHWQSIRRRWDAIRRRDYFRADAAERVVALLGEIEQTMKHSEGTPDRTNSNRMNGQEYCACTWVTRQGVKIDRIASAWLIQRFIDPAARFLFVEGNTHEARPSQIRFDMFDGEFTHRGTLCTFEVLVEERVPNDRVLREIGEIVHEIDLKDDRYGRPEAVGIAVVIDGLVLCEPDDARRLEMGRGIFDGLYERIGRDPRGLSVPSRSESDQS